MRHNTLLPGLLALCASSFLYADNAAIEKSVRENMRGAKVASITQTPIKDLFQVELTSGEVVHVSGDGSYLLAGDLYSLSGGLDNLTEGWRAGKRIDLIKGIKDEDTVVFPAQGVEKGQVYVFTDTSCGYCQKFHAQMPEVNAKGITVKYLAWPRYGLQSPDGVTMTNVWCSEDRRAAMTQAKSRKPVAVPEGKTCDTSVIDKEIDLGHRMGVRGTPALFDASGEQLGGYVPADALAKHFEKK